MNSSKILSRPARRALLCGTALGASLLIVGAPGLALAGPDDVVINQPTASTTNDNWPAVQAATGGSITATVGTVTTTGRNAYGVDLMGYDGVTVDIGSVTTTGDASVGMAIWADAAPVTIDVDTVHTSGDNAAGIHVEAGGDITIRAGSVTTEGDFAEELPFDGAPTGVYAHSLSGTTNITATGVTTAGTFATGIDAAGQVVSVAADAVTTTGDNAIGILAVGETVTVDLGLGEDGGTVTTSGQLSHGISTQATGGLTTIIAETVTTTGLGARGIDAHSDSAVSIDVGAVVTSGQPSTAGESVSAHGIVVETTSGQSSIKAGSVTTGNARGISFEGGADGSTAGVDIDVAGAISGSSTAVFVEAAATSSIRVGSIAVTGVNGNGVRATMTGQAALTLNVGSVTSEQQGVSVATEDGDITATLGSVTGGDHGAGVNLGSSGAGDVTANIGSVVVNGPHEAVGIYAELGDVHLTVGSASSGGSAVEVRALQGDVFVDAGTLSSLRRQAHGLTITASGGSVEAHVDDVTTQGDFANGVHIETDTGPVVVDSGDITTTGAQAHGIYVQVNGSEGGAGDESVTITSQSVATGGTNAGGIVVRGRGGPVTITSTSVETTGNGAPGISASTTGGDIEINSQSVRLDGSRGVAIGAYSESGNISVTSTSVYTEEDGAWGISAQSDTGDVTIDSGTIRMAGSRTEDQNNAAAIYAQSFEGDVSVISDSIVTGDDEVGSGDGVFGLRLESAQGDISVQSGEITTHGDDAIAMRVQTEYGDIDVTSGDIATGGDDATGISLETFGGRVTLVSDSIVTDGDDSMGISILANGYPAEGPPRPVSVTSGSVITGGRNATGIEVRASENDVVIDSETVETSGDNAAGIWAQADHGDMVVTSDSVTTTGAFASGIELHSTSGDIRLTSGTVSTAGDGAHGIGAYSEDGLVSITSTSVTSNGGVGEGRVRAAAIWGQSRAGVEIISGSVVANGANRHGVVANSSAGPVTLQIGSVDVNGDGARAVWATAGGNITASFTGAIDSDLGQTIDLISDGAVSATIGANASIFGGTGAVRVESGAAGSTIRNNGSIQTDSGYAIDAVGGAATINNAGNLRGLVRLTGNADSLFNTGTWMTAGESIFGAGADQIVNHGLIELAAGAAVQTITFTDLERIDNQGRIDLANGRAGDRLVATGAVLNGLGTGVIDMDVDFATGASDQLVIASATGVTRIDVTAIGTVQLGQSFDLIDSAAALTGSEFILTPNTEETLVGFDLVFEGEGVVRLAAAPTVTAFAPLKTAAAGQRAWTKTAEVWSTRMSQIRDIEALGGRDGGLQVWTQAYGGEDQFGQKSVYDLANGPVTRDLTTESQWFGFQAGVDGVISTEPASFAWGLTGGYGDMRLDFVSHDNLVTLDGFNLGAYGGVSAGMFYANALVKLDRFSAKAELNEMATSVHFDGQALGVQAEAGARIDAGGWTVEPSAGAAWVKADLDGFEVAGSEIGFDDAVSLEGRVGVRVSTTTTVGGLKLRTFAGGYAVKEFEGENEMTFTNGGTAVSIKDKPADAYGRIEFGATAQVAPGVHGFIRGEANVGDNASGFTGRFGASWSW